MDNQRTEPRFSQSKPAQILVLGEEPVACTLTDSSPFGACLSVPVHRHLPETFILKVPATGLTRQAEVVWRRRAAVGVRFRESRPAAKPAGADGPGRQDDKSVPYRADAPPGVA